MNLRSTAIAVMGSFVFAGCATAIDDGTGGRVSLGAKDTGVLRVFDDTGVHPTADTGSPPEYDSGTPEYDSGTPEYDTGPGYDTAPPERDTYVDPGGDPCSDCANTKCYTEIDACMKDTECNAQMDCLSTCSDSTCADACAAAHPSTKVDDMFTCVETKCSAECGGPMLTPARVERAAVWPLRGI